MPSKHLGGEIHPLGEISIPGGGLLHDETRIQGTTLEGLRCTDPDAWDPEGLHTRRSNRGA